MTLKHLSAFRSFLFLFIAITGLSLASCEKKDKCNDSCVNGYCSDGDCICDANYGGKWCATYTGNSSSSGSSSSGSSSSGSSSSGSSSSGGSYTVTFWSNFSGSPISVYIGGSYAGQITSYYSSVPSCGASGCVTQTYSTGGTLSYTAEDDTYNWSGTVTLSTGCTTMNLHL